VPALTADPAFVSGQSHGIRELLADCEAALMGHTTFEPALNNDGDVPGREAGWAPASQRPR